MRLKDLATIKIDFEAPDFWVVRRGSLVTVGSVTRTFNREHFGVKVFATDILLPDYLYYAMMDLHTQGYYKLLAHGTLPLVNIRLDDVKNIPIG